jgi:uncharacterized RDD family membrane protein YckC
MKHDFGNRAIAFLIDSVIVGIVASIVQAILSARAGGPFFVGINVQLSADDLYSILIYALYYLYFATKRNGITIGKQAMNLEVRYTNGTHIPTNKLIERELLKAVLMPISIVSLLLVAIRDDHKSIHDIVIDTQVYTTDSLTNDDPDIFEQTEDDDPFDNYYR